MALLIASCSAVPPSAALSTSIPRASAAVRDCPASPFPPFEKGFVVIRLSRYLRYARDWQGVFPTIKQGRSWQRQGTALRVGLPATRP